MNEKDFKKYIFKNYNVINEIEEIGDKYFVKENVETNNEAAYTYIGSLILSMSKRIMNEFMCSAEDLDLEIFYQDTDSMHMNYDEAPILTKEFKRKYGRELVGKNIGHFHIDFEMDGAVDDIYIYAVEKLVLG